ncbi:MAG: helix-turn-helix transcriptional regulator [Thermomicrobiales bacterium]|nr:helix-turn-helix transcriptional regulator [Thermomicrobiales bacterium]MCO5222044.1 helix-turn-helix transcriptional regulator [Thermomicrobiales bacterium]
MGKSFRELQVELPVDRDAVEAIKREMLAEVRAYRLRELREQAAMTQVQLAGSLDVSQNRISRIENGDIERTQVDTLRRYVEAFGGKLHIEVVMGDERFTIA